MCVRFVRGGDKCASDLYQVRRRKGGGGAGSVRALNRGSSPHAVRQVAPPKECPTAESLSAVVARGVARVRLQLRRGACGGALRVRAMRFCKESSVGPRRVSAVYVSS